MNNRYEYEHQTWDEFEAALEFAGISVRIFCKLSGQSSGSVDRWKNGILPVPIWATQWIDMIQVPEAREAMNHILSERLRLDKRTGETFNSATVERIKR